MLMGTQLILNILHQPSYGLQVFTFCLPHPTALKYSQYSVIAWRGVIKAGSNKVSKKYFASQDRIVTLIARAVSHQPPAVLQHSFMHHMVWITGWVQLFPYTHRANHTPKGNSAWSILQAGNAVKTPPELDSIWFGFADTLRNVFIQTGTLTY